MTANKTQPVNWTEDEVETIAESAAQVLHGQVRRAFLERCKADPDFSQQLLADRIGVPRAQVSRWLGSPSALTLRAAARLLLGLDRRVRTNVVEQVADQRQADVSRAIRELQVLKVRFPTSTFEAKHLEVQQSPHITMVWPRLAGMRSSRNLALAKCSGNA